jgi:translation initiation factor 2 subunit 2
MSEADLSSELTFDKKKKKKKSGLILDDAEIKKDTIESLQQREKMDEQANEDLFGDGDGKDIDTSKFDEPLDLGLKKKKKKKKVIDIDNEMEADFDGADAGDDLAAGLEDLDLSSKKKKKKKEVNFAPEKTAEPEQVEIAVDGEDERPWLKRDMDREGYLYDELINRVYGIIDKKNPQGIGGTQKLTMRPPALARLGTKKMAYTNFRETCNALKRREEHLMCFIFAELGTTGNQDGNGHLILKGKFNSKSMEKVLRQYIKDFVRCKTCNCPETTLNKRERLYFLKCDKCQSERSVSAIKTGFQAVVGKRSRMRTAALAAVPK